jgi:hypothetical protein
MADPILDLIHPVDKTEPFRVEINGTNSSPDVLSLINPIGAETADVQAKPVNAPYASGQQAPGALRGLMSVINGPAMGFGDEILGGIGGAYDYLTQPSLSMSDLVLNKHQKTFSELYKENRDYVRGAQDTERENNPWTTGLTQAAASAPLMAVKLGALLEKAPAAVQGAAKVLFGDSSGIGSVMNLGQRSMRAGVSGGTSGAINGAGNSTAEDLSGVIDDSLIGGGTGMALGGALPTVAAVTGAPVKAAITQASSRLSDSFAADMARRKLAEMLVRDGRGTVVQDGLSNPVNQAIARFGKLGPDAVIADSAGANTRQLLDTLATLPGKTKDAVENFTHARMAGSANRMITAADSALDNNGQRLMSTVDSLIEQRTAAAKPLYDQVRQISVAPSPNLQSIISAADELGATGVAKKMAKADRVPFSLDANAPTQWSMGDLDQVKKGLDTMIDGQRDSVTGKLTALGSSYAKLKSDLVSELDNATTDPKTGQSVYKAARDAFAGPSALVDAANSGRASLSQKGDVITKLTSGFSESEKEAFRVGAFEALRDKVGSSQAGRTEVQNMWQNPGLQEKLKAIFGSERAFREFAADTASEARLKLLNKTGQGSQTAARAAGAADMVDVGAGVDALGHAASGNVVGALGKAKNFFESIATPEPVRDQIGRLLLQGGSGAMQEFDHLLPITRMLNQGASTKAQVLGGVLANQQNSLPWFNPQP